MKTKRETKFITGVIALLLLLPSQVFAADEAEASGKRAKTPCAWIGVLTVPLPQIVSEHVGLGDGEGVMVEAILAGSPAEKAGILKRDIITHADSEIIAGGQALSGLVISKKPGDTIVLNIRRKNESMQVPVKLMPKPDKIALSGQRPQEPVSGFPLAGSGIDQRLARIFEQMEDMDRGLAEALEAQAGAIASITASPGSGVQQRMEISLADREGRLTISTLDGKTSVKLWDTQGNLLYDGPYTTEEEKNAVPEDLRKRIDKVSDENPTLLWVFEGFRDPVDQPEDETEE